MATSKRCSNCQKGVGIYFCTGCNLHFCRKDFQTHRETLTNQLDGYIEDRNVLQEQIIKSNEQNNLRNPLLLQIDEWEKSITEKVKRVAEQVRQKIIQILNSKRLEITSAFEKLSLELIELKETEDFAEHDLKRLKETINQFNQDLKQLTQPTSIELHMEDSKKVAWDRLIYVVEKTDRSNEKRDGNQRLDEDALLVNFMEETNIEQILPNTRSIISELYDDAPLNSTINRTSPVDFIDQHNPINILSRSSSIHSVQDHNIMDSSRRNIRRESPPKRQVETPRRNIRRESSPDRQEVKTLRPNIQRSSPLDRREVESTSRDIPKELLRNRTRVESTNYGVSRNSPLLHRREVETTSRDNTRSSTKDCTEEESTSSDNQNRCRPNRKQDCQTS